MRRAVLVLVLTLAFAQIMFAGAFSIYPGATRVPDAKSNPNHAIGYTTPDAYGKVIDYYKKDNKVVEDMPGVAEIHFDGGEGILVRDMKQQGTIIVVNPKTK
jgi:hypothetical protein